MYIKIFCVYLLISILNCFDYVYGYCCSFRKTGFLPVLLAHVPAFLAFYTSFIFYENARIFKDRALPGKLR